MNKEQLAVIDRVMHQMGVDRCIAPDGIEHTYRYAAGVGLCDLVTIKVHNGRKWAKGEYYNYNGEPHYPVPAKPIVLECAYMIASRVLPSER